jgi:hypothetical protein
MPGNLNDFKASFKTDIARANKFDVSFPVPLTLILYRNISQRLTLRCESAELPGRSLATTEQKIYNISEKFPYQTTYNDANFTFLVSDDMAEKEFFDSWLEFINPSTNFNFKYKGDYSTTVSVNQYDVQNKKTYSVDLIEAYPVAVNQMSLDWASDSLHKLTVTFAYSYSRVNSLTTSLKTAVTSGIGGLVTGVGGLLNLRR